MSKPYYREATVEDAFALVKAIRPEDRAEVEGLGYTMFQLPFLVMLSQPAVAFFDGDDTLAGIGGAMDDPNAPDLGIVWLLCTPVVQRKPHTMVREARRWLDSLVGYKMVWNIADARNSLHHKFLRLLGFKFLRVVNKAPHFLPYYEIVRVCAHQPPHPLGQR